MTKEYHILPIINRNDLIKANDHVWIYLSLFITDDMIHHHMEIMHGLNRSQQTFLIFFLLDGIMRNDSSSYSVFSNMFNIFGCNTNRGFLQFIYDGYDEYIFEKPFSETIETWGAKRTGEIIEKAKIIYENHKDKFYKAKILKKYSYLHSEITDFEKLDIEYMLIINEETEIIKKYITNNINDFAIIDEDNTQINYIDNEIIEINSKKEIIQEDNDFINQLIENGSYPNLSHVRQNNIAGLQDKIIIRYPELSDCIWLEEYDNHIHKNKDFNIVIQKTSHKEILVVECNGKLIGFLRYNFFWDIIPFLNMIYFQEEYRNMGFGRKLIKYWEQEMKQKGYNNVLTSTQSDERAQHFYRKLGYNEIGGFKYFDDPYEILLQKILE